MFNLSHSLDISCDAPPYMIVRASRMVGFRTPEDVPWHRLSHFRHRPFSGRELFTLRTWKELLGFRESRKECCSCGRKLPELTRYTFTLSDGREVDYRIGQCGRCRTIFWE
jgi:hypothetical protein